MKKQNNTKEIFDAGIKISKKAAERLSSVMEAEGKKGFGLRMEVTTGGCSGMNYDMSFEKEQKEFDKVFNSQGMNIFCDLKSYLYLKGIEIDFSSDMLNGGFKIVNPNAERTCGCGTSFSVQANMKNDQSIIDSAISQEYEYGFTTDIDQEKIPPGLNEDVIRIISSKKQEPKWLLNWRLKAYKQWLKMEEPDWSKLNYEDIDFQSISYYAAPKQKEKLKSLDEVDPELLDTYNKLGIPLEEQKMLANVAVDAVFDSVSVTTTFKEELEKHGCLLYTSPSPRDS